MNRFDRGKSSVLVGKVRWPIPVWDIRWIWADPVRRDLVLSTVVGAGVGAMLSTVPNAGVGLWAILFPFLACIGYQVALGVSRLIDTLSDLRSSPNGSIKVLALFVSLVAVIAAMVVYPLFGLLVGIALLVARYNALMDRADVALLLYAALIWFAAFVSAVVLYRWPVVPIVLFTVLGLYVGFDLPANGFRVGRLPIALVESTTLVFGIVLGGLSIARTAVIVVGNSPSISQVESIANGRPKSANGPGGNSVESLGAVPGGRNFVHVDGYFRTVADGDPTNNFSFGGGQPNRNVEFVSAHVRTAPDGIVENNLSYKPPTSLDAVGVAAPDTVTSPSEGTDANVLMPSRPDHLALIVGVVAVASMHPNPILIEDVRFRARRNFLWRSFLDAPTSQLDVNMSSHR